MITILLIGRHLFDEIHQGQEVICGHFSIDAFAFRLQFRYATEKYRSHNINSTRDDQSSNDHTNDDHHS